MAETAEELRRSLSALRLERGSAKPPPRRPRWVLVAIAVGVLVAVLVGLRVARGRTPVVEVGHAGVPAAGDGAAAVPVLSGAGYVVSRLTALHVSSALPPPTAMSPSSSR